MGNHLLSFEPLAHIGSNSQLLKVTDLSDFRNCMAREWLGFAER